jgi:hypothetical protein
MSTPVYRISHLLSRVLDGVTIGTNLGLYFLFWMILSGRLLISRGAVIPGLDAFGLPKRIVRRSWAAFAYGAWNISRLVDNFRKEVLAEGRWQPHAYGGYRPVAADLVGFFRPHLQDCPTKHYSSVAGKALPAIPLGLIGAVGSVGGQRLAVPRSIVESDPTNPSETELMRRLLVELNHRLAKEEIGILDGGFRLSQIQSVGLKRYLVRGPDNFTARRAEIVYKGKGRHPQQGEIVRPLARSYKGHQIAATDCDREETWNEEQPWGVLILRARFWDGLVLEVGKPVFRCIVIDDPRYDKPLLLLTESDLSGRDALSLYRDRWPIEGIPLVAKQMLGAGRQFVFGEKSRQRLPEVALLSGAILSYLAATEPAIATGFWDRHPKPTAGRLRRALARVHFEDLRAIPERLREKQVKIDHLLTGILRHQRRKREPDPPVSRAKAA